ncbi:hypothetical protein KGO95_01565 [Patescibacteria group bacterium]|nr:hypothetical protein [Patescibacteria group bacterium]
MNWLKLIKYLVIILIIVGIVWLVRFFFFSTPAGQNILSALLPQQAAQPVATSTAQQLNALTSEPIFDYWVSTSTNAVFYATETGQIMKLANAQTMPVTSQTITRLHSIAGSYDGAYAVAEFNYPSLPLFSVLTTANKTWQPLPVGTIAAAWSPDKDQLAYLSSTALNILDMATNKTTQVMPLTQEELAMTWVTDSKIVLSTLPTAQLNTETWTIDPVKKTITSSLEAPGTVTNWSPDGTMGIMLTNTNNAPVTSLIDPNQNQLSQFSFVTMPEKCAFDGTKIYCAIPKNIPTQATLPDDFYKKSVYFDDAIYLIDLSSGGFTQAQTGSANPIDATHLEVQGSALLFINRLDNKLYSLTLQ